MAPITPHIVAAIPHVATVKSGVRKKPGPIHAPRNAPGIAAIHFSFVEGVFFAK